MLFGPNSFLGVFLRHSLDIRLSSVCSRPHLSLKNSDHILMNVVGMS